MTTDNRANFLQMVGPFNGSIKEQHHLRPSHSRIINEQQEYPRHSGGDASSAMLSDRHYSIPTYHQHDSSQKMLSTPSGLTAASNGNMSRIKHQCRPEYEYNMRESYKDSTSNNSTRTVVNKKSAKNIRTDIKSHCNLLEEIDTTLKKKRSSSSRVEGTNKQNVLQKRHPTQQDVVTEIAHGDLLDFRTSESSSLDISVDDIVNSKVVNPIIRKFQRMYLNNLREEIAVMEDLDEMPQKINDIYRASIEQNRR